MAFLVYLGSSIINSCLVTISEETQNLKQHTVPDDKKSLLKMAD